MTKQNPMAFLVDDNDDNIEMMKVMMSIEKFATRAVYGGVDAMKWLQNNPAPDLIVLDINMPDIDGREIYEYIRQDAKYDQSSVIIVSANVLMLEVMKKTIKAEDHVLQKPFQMIKLQKILQTLYKKITSNDGAYTQ